MSHEYYQGDPGDEQVEYEYKEDTAEGRWGVRTFETGATRDSAEGKMELAGYLSPLVIKRYGEYMLKHQYQSDGVRRAAGNWKKGIPLEAYMESLTRHHLDVWLHHEGYSSEAREDIEEALCAVIFNSMGYLLSILTSDMLGEGNQPEE